MVTVTSQCKEGEERGKNDLQDNKLTKTERICQEILHQDSGLESTVHLGLVTHLHHVRLEADVPEEASDAAREQDQNERNMEDQLQQAWVFAVTQRIHDLRQFVFQQLIWDGRQPEDVLHLSQDRLQQSNKTRHKQSLLASPLSFSFHAKSRLCPPAAGSCHSSPSTQMETSCFQEVPDQPMVQTNQQWFQTKKRFQNNQQRFQTESHGNLLMEIQPILTVKLWFSVESLLFSWFWALSSTKNICAVFDQVLLS